MSSGVGVAMTSGGSNHAFDHVYFSRLAEQKILAVVVAKSGVVRDRVLRVDHDILQGDLDLAARYINDNFRGWSMEKIRTEIARRIEQERSEYARLMQAVEILHRQGALDPAATGQSTEVAGASTIGRN